MYRDSDIGKSIFDVDARVEAQAQKGAQNMDHHDDTNVSQKRRGNHERD